MPAAATTISGRPGQEALDLSVCVAILKKALVLIPILVMIIVYLIQNHLPEDQSEQPVEYDYLMDSNFTKVTKNDTELILSDSGDDDIT